MPTLELPKQSTQSSYTSNSKIIIPNIAMIQSAIEANREVCGTYFSEHSFKTDLIGAVRRGWPWHDSIVRRTNDSWIANALDAFPEIFNESPVTSDPRYDTLGDALFNSLHPERGRFRVAPTFQHHYDTFAKYIIGQIYMNINGDTSFLTMGPQLPVKNFEEALHGASMELTHGKNISSKL